MSVEGSFKFVTVQPEQWGAYVGIPQHVVNLAARGGVLVAPATPSVPKRGVDHVANCVPLSSGPK